MTHRPAQILVLFLLAKLITKNTVDDGFRPKGDMKNIVMGQLIIDLYHFFFCLAFVFLIITHE
jgi:hypothetical protein